MNDENLTIKPSEEASKSNQKEKANSSGNGASASGLKFEVGFCGDRPQAECLPQQKAAVTIYHSQTVQLAGYLLIPWFGKLHYVSPELFRIDAEKYHELHWKDAWFLLDSIDYNKAVFDEWADPGKFFDSCTANAVYVTDSLKKEVTSWWKGIETAPGRTELQEEFKKLSDRTMDIIERLAKWELSAEKVVQDGIDLERIRSDTKHHLKQIREFQQRQIDTAEQITEGLQTVESTAFQILNVVPTLTLMDPFREAVYKIGVLLLRASARGVGGYTAWGTKDAVLREAFGVIQREGPQVIVEIILRPINGLIRSVGGAGIIKHPVLRELTHRLCLILVRQIIEFLCWYFKTILENQGKEITDKQWEDMIYERMASLVGDLISVMIPTHMGDSARRTLSKAVAESAVRNLVIEGMNARRLAKDQNRDVMEILMADLPGMLMRLIQGTIVGLIERRSQQCAQFVEQQRATRGEGGTNAGELAGGGGTTFTEARKILKSADTESFRPSSKTIREIQAGRVRNPVPAFSKAEYDVLWKRTNYGYRDAEALRQHADDNNLVMIFKLPAPTRVLFTESKEARGATAPKPMAVKGKTSNHPRYGLNPDGAEPRLRKNMGLVLKPAREDEPGGPTHKNYFAAKEAWDKSLQYLIQGGFMVSPDRVVFHPDQLLRWAQLHPGDAGTCAQAVAALQALSAKGVYDLTENMPVSPAVRELLARVKIGFYSDTDMVEAVDFKTGQRRFMGDLGEKDGVLQLARDNREHANADLNIHEYTDPELSPDVHQLARRGDALQHGGSNETITVTAKKVLDNIVVYLDEIGMAFPGGEVVVLDEKEMKSRGYSYEGLSGDDRIKRMDRDIRRETEAEVNSRMGESYQPFDNRAEKVKKAYDRISPSFKGKENPPPEINPRQLENVQKMFNGIEILDEPGLGIPVKDIDIANSLMRRGLSMESWEISKACVDRWNAKAALKVARDRYETLIGIENLGTRDNFICGGNIVIAVSHHGGRLKMSGQNQTMADALDALLRTREALGNICRG